MARRNFSVIRQTDINRWFEMFKANGTLTQDQYHDFCKWAKGKQQPEVFQMIHKKQNPLAQ